MRFGYKQGTGSINRNIKPTQLLFNCQNPRQNFADIFLKLNLSVKIGLIISRLICNSCIVFGTLVILTPVIGNRGCPLLGLSVFSSRPSLNLLRHSITLKIF